MLHKKRKKIPERQLKIGIKKPGLKFNLGLALMSLRTTGPDLQLEHKKKNRNFSGRPVI